MPRAKILVDGARSIALKGDAACAMLAIFEAGRRGLIHAPNEEWKAAIGALRAAGADVIFLRRSPNEDPRWVLRGRIDLLEVERE